MLFLILTKKQTSGILKTIDRQFWWLNIYKKKLIITYGESKLKEINIFLHPSLLAQMVKNQPAMQETYIQSLGQKDPLEKGMATHSSILPGGCHGQRILAGYRAWGCKELDMTEWLRVSLVFPLYTHQSSKTWKTKNIYYERVRK